MGPHGCIRPLVVRSGLGAVLVTARQARSVACTSLRMHVGTHTAADEQYLLRARLSIAARHGEQSPNQAGIASRVAATDNVSFLWVLSWGLTSPCFASQVARARCPPAGSSYVTGFGVCLYLVSLPNTCVCMARLSNSVACALRGAIAVEFLGFLMPRMHAGDPRISMF